VDIGKSFTYMFEDKDWIAKIAIGGLITLIPIVGTLIVLGYVLRVVRNVYDDVTPILPEWNDIGDMLVKGFMAFLGLLIWSLPVIVLACCTGLVLGAIGSAGGDSDNVSSLMGLVGTCMYCLMFVVALAISLFVYAPLTNFALNNQIATFWNFGGMWKYIQANPGNYLIAFLLALVANFIAGFGIILCFIGVIFTSFWAMLVMGHLFGQVARTNLPPTDSSTLPPAPPMDEPPGMMPSSMEPAPSA